MTTTKVYAGLTLSEAEVVAELPGALVAPPVERGQLPRDVAERVGVIVIVDGRFHHSRAVSPTEIVDALRAGVRVYGCSSMGALRAAELHRLGMVGHGRIYEHIRATPSFRDDFVGQTIHPTTFAPLSAPYVDLQFSLQDAQASGALTAPECALLLEHLARLHYGDRSLRAAQHLVRTHLDAARQSAVLAVVATAFSREASHKRADAVATLRRVATELRDVTELNARLGSRAVRRPLDPFY